MPELLIISGFCSLICAVMGVFITGYNKGVRDTEKRWSEIVSRANYERDMSKSR